MKLSELTTDGALDALCQLTPYIANITTDQDFVDAIGKLVKTEGMSVYGMYTLIIDRVSAALPVLLGTHREDVYGILSVVNQKPPKEIAAQSIRETVSQLKELVQDPELLSFFKSFMGRGKTEPSAPSVQPPA